MWDEITSRMKNDLVGKILCERAPLLKWANLVDSTDTYL